MSTVRATPVRRPAGRPSGRRHGSAGRSVTLLGVLLVAVLLATLGSLAVGSRAIGLDEVLGAVLTDVDSANATVIRSQRVPRTLLALAVGAALGAAGALMQGHTRNALADPGLFGVNAGAAFGVALLVFGLGVTASPAILLAALLGAGLVSALVLVAALGGLRGSAMVTIAVIGATLSLLFSSLSQALVLLDRRTLDTLRFWESGAVSDPQTESWWLVMPLLTVGLLLAVANAWPLRALTLGEDVAQAQGVHVLRARVAGIGAITLLAGASTAICGPIGFLGLVAPHAVRWATGPDYRRLVPLAALTGCVLLLVSDTLGRVALPGPAELEAGIVMAAIGAPVLLAVVRRRRLVAL